jgi:phosphoadenosine phosphosulfate reductase
MTANGALDIAALAQLASQGAQLVDSASAEPGADHVSVSTRALVWAYETFGARLAVASSMGDEVLVHLASVAIPTVDVLFIDTGYHFAETIGLRDALAATTSLSIRTLLPLATVAEQDATYGANLFERDPDQCCALRKVDPLERGLLEYDAWVTGMRREDAPTRRDIDVIGWDTRRNKVKLNPLALWTSEQVDAYVEEHGVLLNPLRQIGYASIGCAPCTRPVAPGEDPRSGRWSGLSKTECGLHT